MKILSSGMGWITEQPGGLNRYLADYTRNLVESGHHLDVVVKSSAQGIGELPMWVSGFDANGLSTYKVVKYMGRSLKERMKRENWDIFNPHFSLYSFDAINKAVKIKLPVVINFHGPWAYEALVEQGSNIGIRSYSKFYLQKWIEKTVYRQGNAFIVLSNFFKEILASSYDIPSEKIHVIPGAVDTGHFTLPEDREALRSQMGILNDRIVMVTVRRLARRMGLENLIGAVNLLRDSFPNLLLLIVGGGQIRQELEQLVAREKLEYFVHFVGRVDDEALPIYYKLADLAVVPTVYLEGFGLTTIEAMACGTPVAGTAVGGTTEILNGFEPRLVLPGLESTELASSLGEILSHLERLPSRKQTREHVLKHYTWPVMTEKILKVFQQVIDQRG